MKYIIEYELYYTYHLYRNIIEKNLKNFKTLLSIYVFLLKYSSGGFFFEVYGVLI